MVGAGIDQDRGYWMISLAQDARLREGVHCDITA